MRLIIAGGGTGGHVAPAVATIAALRHRLGNEPLDLLWLGSADGVETLTTGEMRIPFRAIQAGKLRRYLSWANLIDTGRIPIGVAQALTALRRFRPDIVFSTGGFVSVPTVIAAGILRRPVLLHEQTAQFGLANQINLRFASTVALPYEVSRCFLPKTRKRVVVTGNPVRPELLRGNAATGARLLGLDPDRPTLYCTGGARGARIINVTLAALLPRLLANFQVIHSRGLQDVAPTRDDLRAIVAGLPAEQQSRYVLRDFFTSELPDIYALASLVISRAGAGTIAELAALGKPAILIPLPGTGGDEQTKNARLLTSVGGALTIPEDDLTPAVLADTIERLLAPEARATLARMGEVARTQAPVNADERLVDELLRLRRGVAPAASDDQEKQVPS